MCVSTSCTLHEYKFESSLSISIGPLVWEVPELISAVPLIDFVVILTWIDTTLWEVKRHGHILRHIRPELCLHLGRTSSLLPSMTRGRKKDLTIPPTRALVQQRDYRARKAHYIADLEERVRRVEAENFQLRKDLEIARAGISVPATPLSHQIVGNAFFYPNVQMLKADDRQKHPTIWYIIFLLQQIAWTAYSTWHPRINHVPWSCRLCSCLRQIVLFRDVWRTFCLPFRPLFLLNQAFYQLLLSFQHHLLRQCPTLPALIACRVVNVSIARNLLSLTHHRIILKIFLRVQTAREKASVLNWNACSASET